MDFTGDFETHLTVSCPAAEIDAVERWAAERGLKFAHIVLDRGRVPSQPMLTLRTRGTLDAARARAEDVAARLRADGHPVTRLKIEASPFNAGVPEHDADAPDPGRYYFEHHVKLLLDPAADTAALAAAARPHAAHLSRNARRVRADGRHERFVTQRCRGVGSRTAVRRLEALVAALDGHEIVSVEREYVVFDGDASLDDGWIEEETRP
ncbi:hypothetical protein [Actinomadura hibisca]|uniref:hypothetical protein n=1 Tax=Actinomadura hibisca TaxID=68565 RepID=UPI0008372F1A|nr:hypothetical protein [Actinomadura hibisca]